MNKELIKLNVIDRDGKKTLIEAIEGISVREAIMDKLALGKRGRNLIHCNFFCNDTYLTRSLKRALE